MVAVVTPRRAAASSFESRILALFPRTLEHVALLRGYLIQHLWFFLFSGGKRPKCLLRLLINAVSLNWNLSGLVCYSENSVYGPVRLGGSGGNAVSIASWRGAPTGRAGSLGGCALLGEFAGKWGGDG